MFSEVMDMPLYEYICQECGQEFEKMVRFSEASNLPPCPVCQSPDTNKRISVFASRNFGGGTGVSASSSGSSCGSSGRFT